MSPVAERPQMELRGLKKRGKVLGAVLALRGATRAELKQAVSLTAMMADHCILVAVDGGFRACRRSRRRPDLFVGDGDSLKRVPAGVPSVIFGAKKEFSDLSGALAEVHHRGVQLVAAAGLLGGRLDHEWANLLELGNWSRAFAGILAPTGRGTVLVTSHGCKAATVRERTFSIFSLKPSSTVTLLGTRWELTRRRLRPGSNGLSNLTGTDLDLIVHSGAVALVFLPPARVSRPPGGVEA